MTKKNYIALADMIRMEHAHCKAIGALAPTFSELAIRKLAYWIESQNDRFDCDRWLVYVNTPWEVAHVEPPKEKNNNKPRRKR
jgi:hypothetical protein